MSEMDEIMDRMKEAKHKRERKKLSKKGFAMIAGAAIVFVILIGTYMAVAMNQDTYWKPKRVLEKSIDSATISELNNTYVFVRTSYDQKIINHTIGNIYQNDLFTIILILVVKGYTYYPNEMDELRLYPTLYGVKNTNKEDYRIKELIFHYKWSDKYLDTTTILYYSLRAKNLYFLSTEGEFDRWSYKIDYEWAELHQLRGINRDAEDIKEAGFGLDFHVNLYDDYPNWTSHTITLTATLVYGKPTIFGWQDVRTISTEVKIEIVNEGGM